MAKATFETVEGGGDLPAPEGITPGTEEEVSPTPRRRGRPPGSGGGASPKKLAELEESLKEKMLEDLILPGAFISPLVAANIEARAERTAKAAVRLAAKNPAVRKGLERAVSGSDVLTIFMFFGTSAICAMVDWGMMDANAVPSRAAGVPELWEVAYPDADPPNGNGAEEELRRRGLLGDLEE